MSQDSCEPRYALLCRGEGQKVTFEPMTEYFVVKCVVIVNMLHVHILPLEKTLCRRLMHMHALAHVYASVTLAGYTGCPKVRAHFDTPLALAQFD